METISIRRKGYPIRHLFRDFVDRYRLLGPGIGPSHCEGDCRSAAEKICKTVLINQDYQIGKTKVFLKVKIYKRKMNNHYYSNILIGCSRCFSRTSS